MPSCSQASKRLNEAVCCKDASWEVKSVLSFRHAANTLTNVPSKLLLNKRVKELSNLCFPFLSNAVHGGIPGMVLAGTPFSAASRPLDAQLHGSSALKGWMRAFKGDETDREKNGDRSRPKYKGALLQWWMGWQEEGARRTRRQGERERGAEMRDPPKKDVVKKRKTWKIWRKKNR